MTTTDQRWWAPAAPGIGPDDYDLQLLTPGDDGPMDLGQAFLALHRVGAAACEAVSTQPLADESTLAFALASAREQVAPEASTIVSKAVGEDSNYANLLIRDVLDDAESSALSLWRSCIAHKVPAPVAAQRVGLVYGLPPSEVLPFQRLAIEPKTPLVSLVDVADRALFGYVSKLVEAEGQERKVEISKMPLADYNRSEEGARHPKDSIGRFARTPGHAFARQVEPDYEDEVAQPAAPAERAKPVPKMPKRPKRPVAAIKPASSAQRSTLRSTASSALASSRQNSQLAALLAGLTDPVIVPVYNKSRQQRDPGDVNEAYSPSGDTAPAHLVEHELAFVMPSDEWMAFNRAARPGDYGKEFRAGRLQDYIGQPEVFEDDEGTEHQRNVSHVVDILRADPKVAAQPREKTKRFDGAKILASDNPVADLTQLKAEFLAEEGLSPAQIRTEIGFVEEAAAYDDPMTGVLVYRPPPPGPDKMDRRIPRITEVIVKTEDLKGYNDAPPGSPPQWRLEKNQTLAFLESPFAGPDSRKVFWDNNTRTFRTRIYAKSISDDVDKALSPERFHQLEEQGYEQRDEQGRFARHEAEETEEAAMPTVAAPVPKRPKVPKRAPRVVGVNSQFSSAVSGSMASGGGSQLSTKFTSKDRRAADPQAFSLADEPHTAVPPWVQFGASFTNEVQPTEKQFKDIELAREGGMIQTEDNLAAIHVDVHRIWDTKHTRELNTFQGVTVEELEDVADAINAAMGEDNNFTLAKIHLQLVDDSHANITVYRNISVFGPRDVVRWGPTNKFDHYSLIPERSGRFQTLASIRALLHNSWDSATASGKETGRYVDDDYIANPWVRVWRAEQW